MTPWHRLTAKQWIAACRAACVAGRQPKPEPYSRPPQLSMSWSPGR